MQLGTQQRSGGGEIPVLISDAQRQGSSIFQAQHESFPQRQDIFGIDRPKDSSGDARLAGHVSFRTSMDARFHALSVQAESVPYFEQRHSVLQKNSDAGVVHCLLLGTSSQFVEGR